MRAHRRHRDDGGFALPVAIFALVVVGVLVTGGFYIARQEARIGTASENSALAFYLAEKGINEALADWQASYFSLPLWTTDTVTGSDGQGEWEVEITHTGNRLFFLDGTGTVTGQGILSGATRRVGLIARLFSPQLNPPAALTTRGPTAVKGSALINGVDGDPPEWTSGQCTPFGNEDKPGVLTDDASNVTGDTTGAGGKGIAGDPPVEEDPTIDDDTFTQFGELSWNELIALANVQVAGGSISTTGPVLTADGLRCNTSVNTNWGDPLNPTSPCASYFPVIHVSGNANVQSGGVGQGILLVDGDLDLRGNFVFFGIIIVQGNFETQGSGNRIQGGVLASNAELESQSYVGGSVVQNSVCAAQRAILENSNLTRARPLTRRSWVDLTTVDPGS